MKSISGSVIKVIVTSSEEGWVGFDLDGTLAEYNEWRGVEHIGNPIASMVNRVKKLLKVGKKVKIFTARVSDPDTEQRALAIKIIEAWCEKHIGVKLPVTCIKDMNMIMLYDDKCMRVKPNTGELAKRL